MFIFQSESAPLWTVLTNSLGIMGGILIAIITYILTKPKTKAETVKAIEEASKLVSDKEKNYSDMVAQWQDKLPVWIERFEKAKEEVSITTDKVNKMRQELQECLDSKKPCKEFQDRVILFFNQLETSLKDLSEHTSLVDEIRALREEIQKRSSAPTT